MNRRLYSILLALVLWAGAWPVFAAEHPLAAPVARALASMRERKVNFSAAPVLGTLSHPDWLEYGGPAYELLTKTLEIKFAMTPARCAELEKDPEKLDLVMIAAARSAAAEAAAEAARLIKAGKTEEAEDYFLGHLPLFGETERQDIGGKMAAVRRENLEAALGPIAETVRRLGAQPIDYSGAHDFRKASPMSENERIGRQQSRLNFARWNPENARQSNREFEEIVTGHFHEVIQAARDRHAPRFVALARRAFRRLQEAPDEISLDAPPAWKLAKLDSYHRQVGLLDFRLRDLQQRYEFVGDRRAIAKFRDDARAGIAEARSVIERKNVDEFLKALGSAKALDRLAMRREIGDPAVLEHFFAVLDFFDRKRREAWLYVDPKSLDTVPHGVFQFQRNVHEGVEALETAWTKQVLEKETMFKSLRWKSAGWFAMAPMSWVLVGSGALLAFGESLGGFSMMALLAMILAAGIGCSLSLWRSEELRERLGRARKLAAEIESLLSSRIPGF